MPITLETERSAESVVLDFLQEGKVARFENGLSDLERTMRASFLRNLTVTRLTDRSVAPVFIEIENAIVEGELKLNGIGSTTAPLPPLVLTNCIIAGGVDLSDSAWTSITLDRCHIGRLTAPGLRVERSLVLKDLVFVSEAPISIDLRDFAAGANLEAHSLGRSHAVGCQLLLDQAHVGGSVLLTGALLASPAQGNPALSMDGIIVKADLFLDSQHRFQTKGAISIAGATIGRDVSFRGASLDNDGKECLVMDGTEVGGDLLFNEDAERRFEANGAICLRGITVRNSVDFTGSKLKGSPDALLLTGAKIDANLILKASSSNRFEATGSVGLPRASVGGQVRMQGASLSGAADIFALDMNQADVRGSVFLSSDGKMRFEAKGLVYLYGANIGRNLVLTGASVGRDLKLDALGNVVGERPEDRRPHADAEHILKDMALDLRQVTVGGKALMGVARRHRFEARGLVCFNGAKIGSEVFLRGASLHNPQGFTLTLDGAQIARNVYFDSSHADRFESRGTISGWGCAIGGGLFCNGAFLRRPGGEALKFDQATILGQVFLQQSHNFQFVSKGSLLFRRARIEGDVKCDGARFFGRSGVVLSLDDATVTGGLKLLSTTAHRFEANGEIRLERAQIGGDLNLTGARLRNPKRTVLYAVDASIGGDVELCSTMGRRFKARGELLLSRATIKGRLVCRGALLHDEQYDQPYRREERRRAFSLYGGVINDKVVMESGGGYRFQAFGFVDLSYTRIGAGVICTATYFENRNGTALSLESAKVTGDVYLTDTDRGIRPATLVPSKQFEAFGDVDLQAVEISGDLSCDGRFRSERYGTTEKDRGKVIVFDNGHVRHRWYVRLTRDSVGEASLRGGRVGNLDDDGGQNWGEPPEETVERGKPMLMGVKLRLDGFTYDRFGPWDAPKEPTRIFERLAWKLREALDLGVGQNIWVARRDWLKRQYPGKTAKPEDFFPQPHEQAAKALFAMGHSFDARRLLNDRAAHRARCKADEPIQRFSMWLYSLGFGSGYLPTRTLVTIGVWWAMGTIAAEFALGHDDPVLVKAASSVEIVRSLDNPDAPLASPRFDPRRDKWKADGSAFYQPHGRIEVRDIACTDDDISVLLYAMDTMLPILDLHMEDKCEVSSDWPSLRVLKGIYAIFGWIIVALAAFTWTGVFRRMPS